MPHMLSGLEFESEVFPALKEGVVHENNLVVKFALTDYNPTRTKMTVSHVRTVTPALAEHALPAVPDNALMNSDLHV